MPRRSPTRTVMSPANASPTGRSHQVMSPTNASSPPGNTEPVIDEVNGDPDFITTRRSFLKAAGFTFAAAVAAELQPPPALSPLPLRAATGGWTRPGPTGALRLDVRRLRGALRIAGHHSRRTAGKNRRQSRSPVVERLDMRRGAGIDSWSLRRPAAAVPDTARSAQYVGRRRQGDRGSPRSNPAAGRRRSTPDADDHQPDDRRPHRRVPRQLQERPARQLRSDLGVGRAGRPCADAWRTAFCLATTSIAQTLSSRFDADFLGTWISPVEYTRGYASRRRPIVDAERSPSKSYHVQIESRLSLTGSNADQRLRVAPGEMGHVVTHLAALSRDARELRSKQTGSPLRRLEPTLDAIAERLWTARGRGLVISSSQDVRVQVLCNFINHMIGAYGATLDLTRPSYQRQGSDSELAELRAELSRGEVQALIVARRQTRYTTCRMPRAWPTISSACRSLVSTAERIDETASLAHFVCPDHHYLESWSDAEAVSGIVSLTQPTILPLHDTRSLLESLSAWTTGPSGTSRRSTSFATIGSTSSILARPSPEFRSVRDVLEPNARARRGRDRAPRRSTTRPFDAKAVRRDPASGRVRSQRLRAGAVSEDRDARRTARP